jgi:hypothetical protein
VEGGTLFEKLTSTKYALSASQAGQWASAPLDSSLRRNRLQLIDYLVSTEFPFGFQLDVQTVPLDIRSLLRLTSKLDVEKSFDVGCAVPPIVHTLGSSE